MARVGNRFMFIIALVLVGTLIPSQPSTLSSFIQSQLSPSSKFLSLQPGLSQTPEFLSMTDVVPSVSSIPNVYASSSFELQVGDTNGNCETIGGTWTASTNTCTLTTLTLNASDSLTIDSGVTLDINGGGSIDGAIVNAGTINHEPTGQSILFNIGGTIDNNSGGIINNYYTFENEAGTISNNSGSLINNDYVILNFDTITNSGAIHNNRGTVYTDTGTTVSALGNINNQNMGVINNYGAITNDYVIQNQLGGTIYNSWYIYSNPGSFIINSGTISGSGTFVSALHSITNTGTITDPVTIQFSETISSPLTLNFSVMVPSGKVLTINGVTLTVPFTTNYLLVHSGGGVLIKAGGAIK